MSGDGVSAELSGGIKIPVTEQRQCSAARERDIERRREREETDARKKEENGINDTESKGRKKGGDVERILEIGGGEIEET